MSELNPWKILVESNLLNIIILAMAIIYLGNKFLPKIVNERKKQISKELEDAKTAKEKAEEELGKIKKKYESLEHATKEITGEAQKTALSIKKQIEEETQKELENIRLKIKKEISASEEEAILNIQRQTTASAIKLAEETLQKIAGQEAVQKKLVEDFLLDLKKPSKN